MTPADHIAIDGDRAWWVPRGDPDKHPMSGVDHLDRPCDTCVPHRPGSTIIDDCPDCIDGRHTFGVEVTNDYPAWLYEHRRTLRVSVVPGMVLPIVLARSALPESTVVVDWENHYGGDPRFAVSPPDTDGYYITLPPAARPGMWAVRLEIHQ